MYVVELGEPSCVPVLLLHGQPGRGKDFFKVPEMLAAKFRVIVADRPGYGRTGGNALGLKENAELFANWLKGHDASPALVVGHSFGGGIALSMAVHYSDVVAGLVLAGSVGSTESLSTLDRVLALPVVGEAIAIAGLPSLSVAASGLRRMSGLLPEPLRERLATSLPGEELDGIFSQVAAVARSFAVEQRCLVAEVPLLAGALGALNIPVAVVAGEWDQVVPIAAQESLARSIAAASFRKVDKVGHFLPRDAPMTVVNAVEEVADRMAYATSDGSSNDPGSLQPSA
ncbi:MAG: alpha/beta hydrolase [Actinobacteria bacterium]|nr:alpha/beta hydrolase [Actinomycetota bacterium]